jgi:hypothetical protein
MVTFSASLTTLTFLLPHHVIAAVRKQTNIGTSTTLAAETHGFRSLSRLVTSTCGRLRYVPLKLETLWN